MAGLVHIQPCAAVCRVELRRYDFNPHMLLTGGFSDDEDSAAAGLPCVEYAGKLPSTIFQSKVQALPNSPPQTVAVSL